MADILSLDWSATVPAKGQHDFRIVSGRLRHNWAGGGGEWIDVAGNTQLAQVSGFIQHDGTCHLLVVDTARNGYSVYQGANEGVWHVQGLP